MDQAMKQLESEALTRSAHSHQHRGTKPYRQGHSPQTHSGYKQKPHHQQHKGHSFNPPQQQFNFKRPSFGGDRSQDTSNQAPKFPKQDFRKRGKPFKRQ